MTETDEGVQLKLEEYPTDDQMERLEDLLTELTLLTRRYKIALLTGADGLLFLDLKGGKVIGVDLELQTKPDRPHMIDRYEIADSILDGVWLVRGPDGELVEQRTVRPPWPRRNRVETDAWFDWVPIPGA